MSPPFNLSRGEYTLLKKLRTPSAIQDFLETLPINFEPEGDTCLSPRRVLREGRAHCMEGAMLAALALRIHGAQPLVVDLTAAAHDQDHVVTVFRRHGLWGAISKTNHSVLRYREPIFRTIRELALSYFHEYTDPIGRKTLRSYSAPLNLARFDKQGWMTSEENVWYIPTVLSVVRHYPLLTRHHLTTLRRADPLEIAAGELTAWKEKT
jgi:hypothetical protein